MGTPGVEFFILKIKIPVYNNSDQHVTHNIYLVLHNRFPTICYPQYIRVHPQYVITIYTLYILWVSIVGTYIYIVGAYVYIVGDIVHCVDHNIYVLSTIYTGPVYIVGALPLSPTIYTHNIYKHPQCIPTIYTAVYIVGIYCGCFTYILWVQWRFTDVIVKS